MVHAAFFVALIVAAAIFALLEIQIEGPSGWASSLPTWRVDNRLTRLLFGSRQVTGYHVYAHLFVLLVLHLPYPLAFVVPSLQAEARIFAFLVLFWIAEDFLWFVLNPAFGIGRFNREAVWWHAPAWWWIMPREYWIFLPVGIALYVVSWT
ncbi:MAG: hypothetical protein GEU90_12240 [Gemmatimonas sp.]|nr:hypothetical protein [Gemmatimonas sp.]